MTTDLEAAFRKQIEAEPENDLHQLVYADWLEERGRPQAELIRHWITLRRNPQELQPLTTMLKQTAGRVNRFNNHAAAADLPDVASNLYRLLYGRCDDYGYRTRLTSSGLDLWQLAACAFARRVWPLYVLNSPYRTLTVYEAIRLGWELAGERSARTREASAQEWLRVKQCVERLSELIGPDPVMSWVAVHPTRDDVDTPDRLPLEIARDAALAVRYCVSIHLQPNSNADQAAEHGRRAIGGHAQLNQGTRRTAMMQELIQQFLIVFSYVLFGCNLIPLPLESLLSADFRKDYP
jgi:uncharacterized protein (TIGR02996 family)